jgi:hypothetical protein
MSLMELFRNYSKGNSGNSEVTEAVTATSPATYSGNSGNSGNSENITFRKIKENTSNPAIKVFCYRVADKPGSELTVITHGETMAEVKNGLIVRRQLTCPVGDNYLDRLTDM